MKKTLPVWFQKYRDSILLVGGVLIGFVIILAFFLVQGIRTGDNYLGSFTRPNFPESVIPGPTRDDQAVFKLTPGDALKLTGMDDPENERWMDIAGNTYTREFVKNFSNKNAQVLVSIQEKSDTLRGRLEAKGLKPNFAYQIKLRGIFEHFDSFEKIGYAGRWRFPGPGTNYSDAEYEVKSEKGDVEAYILFDFFVTDKNGNASREFVLDSSLHVLWNGTRQGSPLGGNEIPFTVDASDPKFYSRPKKQQNIESLWAERELVRYSSADQKSFLPKGKYIAEIVLTEESFHSYDNDGGYWATVFKGKIEFTIE